MVNFLVQFFLVCLGVLFWVCVLFFVLQKEPPHRSAKENTAHKTITFVFGVSLKYSSLVYHRILEYPVILTSLWNMKAKTDARHHFIPRVTKLELWDVPSSGEDSLWPSDRRTNWHSHFGR
jgi:hypothetical protein